MALSPTSSATVTPHGSTAPLVAGLAPEAPSHVVLVHGLGRSSRSLRPLAVALQARGHSTWLVDYPSTRHDVHALVDGWLAPTLDALLNDPDGLPVHVVTHSMGGILLRAYLERSPRRLPTGSRVVMLAPPNGGSEVIDRLGPAGWFQRAMGPAAQQLNTHPDGLVRSLPGWHHHDRSGTPVPLGIVAGTRSADPWFNGFFDGQHDGKVSVASAHLHGSADTLVVPATHTFMMNAPIVQQAVLTFLHHGRFVPVGPDASSLDRLA